MPAPISGIDILKTMIRSGENAIDEFSLISGGGWFGEAPEYFLTTHVSRSIKNQENVCALLEVSVDQTRKDAGASRRGRAARHERRKGRFDIVLYWANWAPRAAVEIKSPILSASKERIVPDVERLSSALRANEDSTFQFGVFLFYSFVSAPKRKHINASQRMRELLGRIKEIAIEPANRLCADVDLVSGRVHRCNIGAWSIASLVFTRAGGMRSFRS